MGGYNNGQKIPNGATLKISHLPLDWSKFFGVNGDVGEKDLVEHFRGFGSILAAKVE